MDRGTETQAATDDHTGSATAIFDYVSTEHGDLSFKAGDQIVLFNRLDEFWLEGQRAGLSGMFPQTYVKIEKEPAGSPRANGCVEYI